MHLLEREIENKVITWARKRGFLTPKVKFVEAGYPDRLFLSPRGHTIFIEFKVPGAKPDLIQFHRIKELRARNIPAFWVDSEFEAIRILQAAMESTSISGESNQADVVPIRSGPLSRSGIGENLSGTSFVKTAVRQGISQAGIDSSSAESHDENMAGRIDEMGRLQGTNFLQTPRNSESGSSESPSPHPPDKSGGD